MSRHEGLVRITRANARFQQWEALLRNRTKRQRARELVVQGVRPISLAIEHGWTVRAVLFDEHRARSRWASDVLAHAGGDRVAMAPELLQRLGEKDDAAPELVAVVAMPDDDLDRIPVGPSFLGMAFDRPTMPGNVGTIVRSLDAFGGSGLVTTGHGADPYDPRAVRASTGSVFAVPVVRAPSHRDVLDWVDGQRERGLPITIVGTDEHGDDLLADVDLAGPTLLVVGNETSGLSAGWRDAVDRLARIPIGGAASSLNAANAAPIALYEAVRQRG